MPEIVKTYRQHIPPLRFVGLRYGDGDRVDGGFGAQWGEWFANGRFEVLEKTCGSLKNVYEDGDAYIGLMRWKDGEPFEYWVGIFFPENAPVPEGYASVDFPASDLGVCWLRGKEGEVYCQEEACANRLQQEGMTVVPDERGAFWFFERYGCPRFTTPDAEGNIILDICHFVAGE